MQLLKQWFCVMLGVFLLSSCSSKPNAEPFQDTKGHTISLLDLQGQWVIVNYWAAWCEGCIKEIPELNRFYRALPLKTTLVGVNFDQLDLDPLRKAIKTAGIGFPVLLKNPGTAWQLSDVTVLPTTFIINPAGKTVKIIVGESTQQSLLAALQVEQRATQ